jgi:hypothetical protein
MPSQKVEVSSSGIEACMILKKVARYITANNNQHVKTRKEDQIAKS